MNKRRLISGSYAAVTTLIAIAIAVVINMVAGAIPVDYTRFDVSGMGLYDLSSETTELVKGVDNNITLYHVVRDGNENEIIAEFLRQYTKLNKKIKVEKLDPEITPTFTTSNGTAHITNQMTENSVIVSSKLRDCEVDYNSIFTYEHPVYPIELLNEYYSVNGAYPEDTVPLFDGERALTSAIDHVTAQSLPVVYMLSGHGEAELGTNMRLYLETNNYELKTLKLKTVEDTIPDDASCIFINAPKDDISASELELLKGYVDGGGKLVAVKGVEEAPDSESNLKALAAYYGMDMAQGMVLEGDEDRVKGGYDYTTFIPEIDSSDAIGRACKKYYPVISLADAVMIQDNLREGVKVSRILYTSEQSVAASVATGNIIGMPPYTIAAHASVIAGGEVVWIASDSVFEDESDEYGGNSRFLLAVFGELCGKNSTVISKSLDIERLAVDGEAANFLTVLMVAAIPLTLIVGGIVIWTVRRKR